MKRILLALSIALGLVISAPASVRAQGVVRNGGTGGGGGASNVAVPATLADGMSNPTTAGGVQAYMMCFNGTTWDRCLSSTAAGSGADTYYRSTDASTNSAVVKASPGTVYDYAFVNITASLLYVRVFNQTTAPTCTSTTNLVETIPIPASTTGAGIVRQFPIGRNFGTGIAVCVSASADGSTNATTGLYESIGFK